MQPRALTFIAAWILLLTIDVGCVQSLQGWAAAPARSMHRPTIARSPLLSALAACPPRPASRRRHQGLPATIQLGLSPVALAVAERTSRLFVLSPVLYVVSSHRLRTCTGSVTTVDLRTGAVLGTTAVGEVPFSIAVDERRNRVIVISAGGMYDTLPGTVSMLDASTGRLLKTTTLDRQPLAGAVAEGADRLFVLTAPPSGGPAGSLVRMIDVTTGLPAGVVSPPGLLPMREEPPASQIVVDNLLNRVFVRTSDGVTALDARSGTVLDHLHDYLCAGRLFAFPGVNRVYAALPGSSHNGQGALCALDGQTLKVVGFIDYGPNAGAYVDVVDERAGVLLVREATYGLVDSFTSAVRDARNVGLLRRLPFTLGPAAVDGATGNILFAADRNTTTANVLTPKGWRILRRLHLGGPISMIAVAQRARRVIVITASGGTSGTETRAALSLLCADTSCSQPATVGHGLTG